MTSRESAAAVRKKPAVPRSTWWREAAEAAQELEDVVADWAYDNYLDVRFSQKKFGEEFDLLLEQWWAMREGLA